VAYRSVLERHAEEAAALWPRRERDAGAEEVGLPELARLDLRVEAHLDGLRLAGVQGTKATLALDLGEPGAPFTVAAQALDRRDAKSLAALLDAAEKEVTIVDGLVGALAWVPLERAGWAVSAMLHERCPPALRRFGLDAHVAHRSDPGLPLLDALGASAAPLRAAAFHGAAVLGRADLLPDIVHDLEASSTPIRFAARLAAALLGDVDAARMLWTHADGATVLGRQALTVAIGRSSPDSAAKAIDRWRGEPRRRRDAALGVGILGDPQRVPWLIEDMRHPDLARLAGASFTRITGIPIAGGLLGAPLEGAKVGPTDDPADEDVDPDPDAALPWPDADAVERAWNEARRRYPAGKRLLFGNAIELSHCDELLRTGSQAVRSVVALERALLMPGRPLVAVRAPGFRQLA
jgi:uncharacterized protein (TIGR02270 family)